MTTSQELCLDDAAVFLEVTESSPEFLYCEKERQAVERLLSAGPEAFYGSIGTERSGCFLSPEEVSQITGWAQDYRVSQLQVPREENEVEDAASTGDLCSTYFPSPSDTPAPNLDLGWPVRGPWVVAASATVHTSPAADGDPHIREIIRRHLQKATEVIAIVTDRLTDGAIIADLHNAASRSVPVYIILNQRSIHENVTLNRLRHPNIRVRSLSGKTFCSRTGKMVTGEMKDKFLLVDLETVIHGSYSLTWADAHLHRQLITLLKGPIVDSFDREFRILFAASLPVADTLRVQSSHADVKPRLKDFSDLRSNKQLSVETEISNPPSPPPDSLLDWEAMGVVPRSSLPESPLKHHDKILVKETPLKNNMLFDTNSPQKDIFTNKPIIDNYSKKTMLESFTNKPVMDIYANKPMMDSYTHKPMMDSSHKPMMDSSHKPMMDSSYKPMMDSYTHKPMVDSYTHKPMMDSYTHKPMMDSYTHKPMMDSYTHKPMVDSYTHKTMVDSYTHKPMMDSSYKPMMDSYTHKPMMDSSYKPMMDSSYKPLMDSYPNKPMVDSYSNKLDSYSNKPMVDSYSNKPMLNSSYKPLLDSSYKLLMDSYSNKPMVDSYSNKLDSYSNKPMVDSYSNKPMVDNNVHQNVDRKGIYETTFPVTKLGPDKPSFNSAQLPSSTDLTPERMKRVDRMVEKYISKQTSAEKTANVDDRSKTQHQDRPAEKKHTVAMLSPTNDRAPSWREEASGMEESIFKAENAPSSRKPIILKMPPAETFSSLSDIMKKMQPQPSSSQLAKKESNMAMSEMSQSMLDLSVHKTDLNHDEKGVPVPRFKQFYDPGHMTPAFALMRKRNDDSKSALYRNPTNFLPRERPRGSNFGPNIEWRRSLAERELEQD